MREPVDDPESQRFRRAQLQVFRALCHALSQGRRRVLMSDLLRESPRKSLSSFYYYYDDLEHALVDYLEKCRAEVRAEMAAVVLQVDADFLAIGVVPEAKERAEIIEARALRAALSYIWREQNLYLAMEAQFDRRFLEVVASEIFIYVTPNWPHGGDSNQMELQKLFIGLFMGAVGTWREQTFCDLGSTKPCLRQLQKLLREMGRTFHRVGSVNYRVEKSQAVRPKNALPVKVERPVRPRRRR